MSFDKAAQFVLTQEGGLVDNPSDPGGLSNMGISLREHPGLNANQIRALTQQDAIDLYRSGYWFPTHADEMPDPVGFVLFDSAINEGCDAAVTLLQLALGITADGVPGPQTIAAANRATVKWTVARFTMQRVKKYQRTANYLIFGDAWLTRAVSAAIEAFS